ncbi:MAG TPA: guanylate kinase [Candidatus Kryptobacter bacterium]|nr:MAG: guanylate kinase [Ignavibacteriae bacterium 37-53-5]HQT91690.1 guanylate kinase [Candidatus Kryptobacter bacterium]
MKRRGMLLVVSAPSGAGKTTIVKEVLRQYPSFGFSVSATTRQKRQGEVDGKDYFFISRGEFEKRIADGELVEFEEIYSNYYGTLKSEVEKALSNGNDIVFDVDVNGGLSIKAKFPEAVLIFVKPPSMEILRKRLEGRGSETAEQIDGRMARVQMELEKGEQFDYIIINDELKRAVNEVFDIINKKRKEFSSGTEAD